MPTCIQNKIRPITNFYSSVNRREQNNESDLVVFENILMSIHNLHSLKTINTSIENPYSIARTQIISWYYSIYYASSAMIGALSGMYKKHMQELQKFGKMTL